jgi:hypothetical protein
MNDSPDDRIGSSHLPYGDIIGVVAISLAILGRAMPPSSSATGGHEDSHPQVRNRVDHPAPSDHWPRDGIDTSTEATKIWGREAKGISQLACNAKSS